MGEIGIPRREFLYELQFWEVQRIIKGYRRRDRLTHQLLAETVYATIHTMRGSNGKTVKDFFPELFEDEEDKEHVTVLTEADLAYERDLMDNFSFGPAQDKAQK